MKKAVAVVMVLLVAVPALACSPRLAHRRAVVVQPYYYPSYYVPVYQFVYPTYFIAYDSKADALIQELRGIRAEIERLRAGQQAENLTGLQVLQNRCASCHGEANANTKGKGFVLLDKASKGVPLSVNEKKRVAARVGSAGQDRMPPAPLAPLSGDERTALEKYLNGDE